PICANPPCGVSLSIFLVEQAFALGIQPNGKIIAGGVLDKQAALVRYHSVTTPKITVANTGSGLGGIWSPDGGINCGTRCSASHDAGSTVLLGWVTAFGSHFAGWTGCTPIPGGGCTLTLNADSTVTAKFNLDLALAADVPPLPSGAVGMSYAVQVSLPGSHPFTSRIVSGGLPAGLILNGRMVSGTPLRPGRSKFAVEFTDSTGLLTKKNFTMTVVKRINVATRRLKAGRVGTPYDGALKVKGGAGPYTWSLISGNLPPGLAVDSAAGRITGLPASSGSHDFVVRATDALGQTADKSFTLIIN
ncbi:MAG TPA: Ig domain-containing protein, partial [Candidatus Binatia bacterium]|nr:Ig domain-containing protein [Candidatus Binatia bacterium]